MRIAFVSNIDDISAAAWNALVHGNNPFLRHEFLAALERNRCVGRHFGWLPMHLAAYGESDRLVAAVPLYLKDNSYGEFVFDWAWADAYQRSGLAYYPKLVAAVPYTPATGQRLLLSPDAPAGTAERVVAAVTQQAQELNLSSLHWLFPDAGEMPGLLQQGLMARSGCQFHWHNEGYRDFDDFLATFTADKRKKLKRERRRVAEAGVELETLHGAQISDELWVVIHDFYRSTFDKKSGHPTLTLGFFQEIGKTMGDQVVVVIARHQGQPVAAAISFRSGDTLYGRHWGCNAEFHSLHFEACYYQGIDYCIRHGLQRFEPGAQGEHKVGRGFRPTATWSAHWIAHPGMSRAIGDFLQREEAMMAGYSEKLSERLPFKSGQIPVK